jgi:DNA-binding NtrC family response regulator
VTRSPRILIVDDEPALRRTLERALRALQFEAISVGNPQLVYEMLDGADFDVVLLDLHLPQISGDALFLAMVRRWPRLRNRIVLMTGDPGVVDSDWPAELRRCTLLAKPFTLDVLHQALREVLAAAEAVEGRRTQNGKG